MNDPASLEVVRHETGGRVLSGVGVSSEALADTMARFEPPAPPAATPDATAAPASPDAPAAPPVETKPSRGAKRFDQLTHDREEAKRVAADAQRERDALKAEVEALKAAQQRGASQPSPAAATAPVAAPSAPSAPSLPDELTSFDKYLSAHPTADYEAFADAKADWRYQHMVAPKFDAQIRQSIEADRASRTRQTRIADIRDQGVKAYPDFDAVMSAPHLQAPLGDEKFAYLLQQPHAHQLAYVIAKDPALYRELIAADPYTFGARLAALTPPSPVASPASTGRAGVVVPPAPYQPVGSGSKTTAPSSAESIKGGFDFDKSGYRERRAQERGGRRRP